jgi:hypothetical protein
MSISIRLASLSVLAGLSLFAAACQPVEQNANTTATSTVTPPGEQKLTQVPRPPAIEQAMKDRGEQDQATPTLRVTSPANNATVNGAKVEVKLELSGDLKGLHAAQRSGDAEGQSHSRDSRQSALRSLLRTGPAV